MLASRKELIAKWYEAGFYSDLTLRDTIKTGALRSPEAFLVLESDERAGRITLQAAVLQAEQYAAALSALGVKQGDVVAVQLPNWIEAAIICQAIWLLGAVVLPVTVTVGAKDLAYILNDAQAKVVFMPAQWRNRNHRDDAVLLHAQTNVKKIIIVGDDAPAGCLSWSDFIASKPPIIFKQPCGLQADDTALLIYTSGTTSKPKGVLHTHNALICEASKGQPNWGEQRYGTHLSPWPHGHIASTITMIRWWIDGVSIVLADKWEAKSVAALVQRYRIEATSGVPYFLSSLIAAADTHNIDISSLKNYATGATNVPAELIAQCSKRGIFAYRMYGSTEHPTATSGVPGSPIDKCSLTDGKPLPGGEVRIVDEQGQEVAAGEQGELALRGPEQFSGYLREEHNRVAFLADGWFLTGDIGCVDAEGYITITDRKKDIIIRGGENISSREVEEAVNLLPYVLESAAVAMPDIRLGEKVCCFVVLAAGAELSLAQVAAHFTASHIARFKTPERLVFVGELPRNATGKIQKHLLRAQLLS